MRLRSAVRKARERGVVFDVGYANGHFDFDLVRSAMGEGLLPDIISSDLHRGWLRDEPGPVIGWQDRLGSLESENNSVYRNGFAGL